MGCRPLEHPVDVLTYTDLQCWLSNGELAHATNSKTRRAPQQQGEIWTAVKVAAWLSKRRGRKVDLVTGWRTLQRLRQSMQLPRPEHPEAASPEDQATFQKNTRDADGIASDTA